jgi:cysteine synthase
MAILPEEMSKERFEWLKQWVNDPEDVVTTPGGEANVKEIYDKCHEVSEMEDTVVFNQFNEFGNALGHYTCTGRALSHIYEHAKQENPDLSLFGFASATGSAGTISAGDRLKDIYGSKICAVESCECPTLLENGFGDPNIQGIGDKHVPFIHNVMNTDLVAGISDAATESLGYLFQHPEGRAYLKERRGVPEEIVDQLPSFGYSGIANMLACIKIAKYYNLGENDALVTVATDAMNLYASEMPRILVDRFKGQFDQVSAAEAFGRFMLGNSTDHFLECSEVDRRRMFNLGYYTWVEQQGVSIPDFEARRTQKFWDRLRPMVAKWDEQIVQFNKDVSDLS